MGGSSGGNFGKTKGSILDSISAALSVAALIPGADTAVDLVSIPVDLLRGDYLSAGFDALGIIPFVGEVADAAKLARTTDNAVDAAKAVKKGSSFVTYTKKIHTGKQGKHIIGHNNYKKGKSILNVSTDTAQELINKYSGTGRKIGSNREVIDFKKVIGKYVDPKTNKAYDTTIGTIHYSNTGTHIVPEKPIDWRK